jgi:hypothetical protein
VIFLGHRGREDLQRLSHRIPQLPDTLLHIENAVDRGLLAAGHLGHYIGDRLQILVIDEPLAGHLVDLHQLPQRHHPPLGTVDRDRQQAIDARAL